jgi:hypothetical protein
MLFYKNDVKSPEVWRNMEKKAEIGNIWKNTINLGEKQWRGSHGSRHRGMQQHII